MLLFACVWSEVRVSQRCVRATCRVALHSRRVCFRDGAHFVRFPRQLLILQRLLSPKILLLFDERIKGEDEETSRPQSLGKSSLQMVMLILLNGVCVCKKRLKLVTFCHKTNIHAGPSPPLYGNKDFYPGKGGGVVNRDCVLVSQMPRPE